MTGPYLKHCKFHPGKAVFSFGSNIGFFSCCQQKTQRFNSTVEHGGCLIKDHTLLPEAEGLALLANHRWKYTQEPFKLSQPCELKAEGDHEESVKNTNSLRGNLGLVEMVRAY